MNLILIIFSILNILSFILFGIDKFKAVKNKYRIKEATLHLTSLSGGFIGSIFAMLIFRHKIKKLKFVLIQIFILILWLSFSYLFYII